MEDGQIVQLYWDRDQQAIVESEDKYGALCRRIAGNLLDSPEDQEECVNDTWLHSWNSIPPQRPIALAAWFGRIVRNLSISRFRAQRAAKRFDGMELLLSELEDCVPAPNTTEQAVLGRSLTQAIGDWLRTLPQADRTLFLRRYWYGDAVTALAMGRQVPANRLSQRLATLRRGLRRYLEQEGFDL